MRTDLPDASALFCKTVISCAIFYQNNCGRNLEEVSRGEMHAALANKLSDAYRFLSQLNSMLLSDWNADSGNPGWLVKVDGALCIRAPVHLVQLFPDTNTITEIFRLGQLVKTTTDSMLYMSGSNAVRKILDVVDDIDFCEYMPMSNDGIAELLIDKLSLSEEIACVELHCHASNRRYSQPFGDRDAITECVNNLNPEDGEKATIMTSFLAKHSYERVFDVSNLIIACDKNYNSRGLSKTFAHQEVAITPRDIVPNKLDDVMNLGRYVTWLIGEIKNNLKSGNTLKSLKRLLSLSRVCWMPKYTNDIAAILDNSTMMHQREIETIGKLRAKVSCIEGSVTWEAASKDLEYFEELAHAELAKAKIKQQHKFPGGVEIAVKELALKLGEELFTHSGGRLLI